MVGGGGEGLISASSVVSLVVVWIKLKWAKSSKMRWTDALNVIFTLLFNFGGQNLLQQVRKRSPYQDVNNVKVVSIVTISRCMSLA